MLIYLGSFYEDGSAFLQQKVQLGLKQQMYGTLSLYSQKLLELAGPAANNLNLSTPSCRTVPSRM